MLQLFIYQAHQDFTLLLKPGNEQDMAFTCIKERLQADEAILEEARRPDGHQFYKITVDTFYVFGKFSDGGPQKYELKWQSQ